MISRNLLALVWWGWLWLSLATYSFGQAAAPASPGGGARPDHPSHDLNRKLFATQSPAAAPTRQDYRLGPGDVITVTVFDIKELNRTLEISANGKITLPFVNEVVVEGLTTQELERALAALLEAKVMKNPQVTVTIHEYRSQPIHVLGAVQKPGTYQVTRKLRLIDALALAGGFTDKAGARIFLRKAHPGAQPGAQSGAQPAADSSAMLEIDVHDLLVNGNAALNYPIDAGDVISVPLRVERVYYVLGDVGKPGAYEFKDKDESVRLSQALAAAGGLLRTASVKDVTVMRLDNAGQKSYTTVNVQQILTGKREDFTVKPNDLIFVPNSAAKNAAQSILNGLSNIVTAGMIVLR